MGLRENLQLILETRRIILRHLVPLTLLGILVNWIFLGVYFRPLFANVVSTALPENLTRIDQIIALLPFLMLATIYVIILPLGYFTIARSYSVRQGLFYIFKHGKAFLCEYILVKVMEATPEKCLTIANTRATFVSPNTLLKRIEGISKTVRILFSEILLEYPFGEIVVENTRHENITFENVSQMSLIIASKLDETAADNWLASSLKPIAVLLLLNSGFIFLTFKFIVEL